MHPAVRRPRGSEREGAAAPLDHQRTRGTMTAAATIEPTRRKEDVRRASFVTGVGGDGGVAVEERAGSSVGVRRSRSVCVLLARLVRLTGRLIFRPLHELFFLISWVMWLFSSITLGTGE